MLPKVIPMTVFCGNSGESDIAACSVAIGRMERKRCGGRVGRGKEQKSTKSGLAPSPSKFSLPHKNPPHGKSSTSWRYQCG